MPTNVAIHAPKGHLAPRNVRVADDYLRSVLDGEASLLFDGGMGTMLQEVGLSAGQIPELLCITEPTKVAKIHAAYVDAGSDVVTTNTFGANARKLAEGAHAAGLVRVPTVAQVFQAAVSCARSANPRYVAADIGPTGSLLRPLGTMSFDEAYDLFAEQVCAAHAAGADLFVIETMADLLEAKAAVLAAKENSDLPIFCTMTFGEDGRTFLGTTPEVAAATLALCQAGGVFAVGLDLPDIVFVGKKERLVAVQPVRTVDGRRRSRVVILVVVERNACRGRDIEAYAISHTVSVPAKVVVAEPVDVFAARRDIGRAVELLKEKAACAGVHVYEIDILEAVAVPCGTDLVGLVVTHESPLAFRSVEVARRRCELVVEADELVAVGTEVDDRLVGGGLQL